MAIVDANDPAYKLAQAALSAVQGDLDAIDRAFRDLEPTTLMIARAYAICLSVAPFSGTEAPRLILNTLQFAVGEKTARRLNVLNWWIAILSGVLVVFGLIAIYLQVRA
jgi:hypothetical protein